MTDNLDMLPEAVRRALGFLPSMACTRDEEDAVNAIRTELLRLARENAELRDSDRRAKAFAAAKQRDCLAQMCRAEKAEAERDELRAFAQDVMRAWPEGGVDGGELQEAAERHGLIEPSEPTQEERDEWGLEDGDGWYRRTALLEGKRVRLVVDE